MVLFISVFNFINNYGAFGKLQHQTVHGFYFDVVKDCRDLAIRQLRLLSCFFTQVGNLIFRWPV